MSHIVESCPLTELNGDLSRLHSADEDAVSWLTSYGSRHAYQKKKKTLKLPHSKISVFNIYRPLLSSTFSRPFSVFLDEFSSFLSTAATTLHEFLITSYFNLHFDDNFSSQFLCVISSFRI